MLLPNRIFVALLLATSYIAKDAQGEPHVNALETVSHVIVAEGDDHPELYVHLEQVGLAYQRDGLHVEAIDTFRHMQSLVHQELGVYSPLQAQSIQHVIRSHVSQRDYFAADRQQKFLYHVMARGYEATEPEMFEARRRLADWYKDTYRYSEALKLYTESQHYLSLEDDKTLAQTSLFLAEAEALYLSGRCCASKALEQAIMHVTPITDAESRRRLRLDYADALMLESDTQAALQAYSQVVGASTAVMLGLGSAREIDEARKRASPRYDPSIEVFQVPSREAGWGSATKQPLPATIGSPVFLCASEFATIYDKHVFASYALDVEIHVDPSGRAQQVSVQGNAPIELIQYVRTVVKRSRYRPGFSADGTPEASIVAFQQTFPSENRSALADDLSGWSSLLARRTCALIDQPVQTARN
jgi:tetratricopeptide (TPR) repeat protein